MLRSSIIKRKYRHCDDYIKNAKKTTEFTCLSSATEYV